MAERKAKAPAGGVQELPDAWERFERAVDVVVKAKPKYVAIADWNQWHEKCAVEDCTDWVDHDGYSTPDWYRQIIQGYVAMCRGEILPGWYYREEGSPNVYLWSGAKLVHQPAYPHRRPTLLTPKGLLDRFPIQA